MRALNPGTVETMWEQSPFAPTMNEAAGQSPRGVDYWRDGDEERLFLTRGEFLYSVDAKSGELDADFGDQGRGELAPLRGEGRPL